MPGAAKRVFRAATRLARNYEIGSNPFNGDAKTVHRFAYGCRHFSLHSAQFWCALTVR